MQQQIIRETFHLVSKRDDNVCNFLEGGRQVWLFTYVLHGYATLQKSCCNLTFYWLINYLLKTEHWKYYTFIPLKTEIWVMMRLSSWYKLLTLLSHICLMWNGDKRWASRCSDTTLTIRWRQMHKIGFDLDLSHGFVRVCIYLLDLLFLLFCYNTHY